MMEKFQQEIQRYLKRNNVKVSESTVSMVLGALVVLIVGILSYNYFRLNRQTADVTPAEVSITNENGEVTEARTSVALPTTHVVAAGENLWSISEKYYLSGYNYVDIAAVNGLRNSNYLQVGQELTIPKVEIRKPVVANQAMYPVVTDSRIEGSSYTVIKGDSLWSIAVRAYGDGFKWLQIAKANGLTNPDLIHAGNVLNLPR